jgi:hypothetical protein
MAFRVGHYFCTVPTKPKTKHLTLRLEDEQYDA